MTSRRSQFGFFVLALIMASLPFIYFGLAAVMDPTNYLEYEIIKITDQSVLVQVTNTSSRAFEGIIAISDGLGTFRRHFSIGPNEQKTVTLPTGLKKGNRQFRIWFEND